MKTGPLPPGRYHVWVDASSYWVEKSLERPPGFIHRDLRVEPGDRPQRVEVILPEGGAVQGRVVRSDGRTPARGYRVAVHVEGTTPGPNEYPPHHWLYAPEPVRCYAYTSVAPDGTFTLFGLVPGRYSVVVRRPEDPAAVILSPPVEVEAGRVADLGILRVQEGYEGHRR